MQGLYMFIATQLENKNQIYIIKQDYKPNIHAYNTRKQYTFGYSHHPPSRAKWPMRAL